MEETFKRVIRLLKKTGDKMIFFDSQEPENSFVMIDLDHYEEEVLKGDLKGPILVKKDNLTNEDLTDKINRDISDWRNQENSPYLSEETAMGSQNFRSNPANIKEESEKSDNGTKKSSWQIPGEVKKAASAIEE